MNKIILLLTLTVLLNASSAVNAQVWTSTGLSYPSLVYTIADYNGTLQVGGSFSTPNEIRAQCVYNGDLYRGGTNGGAITNVYKNGVSIGATNGGSNLVFAMAVYNNQLYAAGNFTSINGVAAINIARWNGSVWTAAGSGLGGVNDYINALCVYNGSLYAGGTQSGNCFQWNGTSWSVAGNFDDNGVWGYIRSMGVFANELYVGGSFTTVDGTSALNLARYNGGSWFSAGDIGQPGIGDGVSAIAEYNGELYCGGHFAIAGGIAAEGIARGNGASWQALGSGTNGVVLALHVFNQSLYVGGDFTNAGGITVSNIAKWAPPCTPPAATITYSGPAVLCNPGGSLLLSANTGTGLTYQWKKSSSQISGATASTYNVISTGGVFTVIVTNSSGCSATSSTVTVNTSTSFANASPSGPIAICDGGGVLLTAYTVTGYTYQWENNGIAIAGATSSTYTATSDGNYTVDETYGACTKTSNTVAVTVNSLPSATITPGGPTTFCSGGSVVLNTSVASNRSYQWKKGANLVSGANLASYTATTGGNYKVIVTNTVTGCSKTTASATVVAVNPLPAAIITPQGPTTFCAGGSVVLQANSGTGLTYQWRKGTVNINGATLQNYTAITGGTYKVTVTNANNCSKLSAGTVVTVNCREEQIGMDQMNPQVYPNPTGGMVTLNFYSPINQLCETTVNDMMGRQIFNQSISATEGLNERNINLSNYDKGVYLLKLKLSSGEFVKRIIVQ